MDLLANDAAFSSQIHAFLAELLARQFFQLRRRVALLNELLQFRPAVLHSDGEVLLVGIGCHRHKAHRTIFTGQDLGHIDEAEWKSKK